MTVITCPRCVKGRMDSEHGVNARCSHCSNFRACYHCDNPECGLTLCPAGLEKELAAAAKPPPPKKFTRGPDEGGFSL